MISVYVAGKFQERIRLREVMEGLRKEGFEITHDWTWEDEGSVPPAELPAYLDQCAQNDLNGVLIADFVLLFGHPELKGALIEAGFALGRRIPVLVIEAEKMSYNIFTRLFVPVTDVAAAILWMRDHDPALLLGYRRLP